VVSKKLCSSNQTIQAGSQQELGISDCATTKPRPFWRRTNTAQLTRFATRLHASGLARRREKERGRGFQTKTCSSHRNSICLVRLFLFSSGQAPRMMGSERRTSSTRRRCTSAPKTETPPHSCAPMATPPADHPACPGGTHHGSLRRRSTLCSSLPGFRTGRRPSSGRAGDALPDLREEARRPITDL